MPALHLPAIAHECGIKFDLFDVAEIFKRTPYIADLKPGGRYVAKDMFEAGGIPLLMKTLLDHGFLHGDCMTVTGRTIAENLEQVALEPRSGRRPPGRQADHRRPAAWSGCKGNLAPEGAIVKVAGMKNLRFAGPARCFDSEEECFAAVAAAELPGRRGAGHPLRGAARRAGHARDAVDHGGALRPGHGRQGRADHRRALLRRDARLLHRPCRRRRRRSAARSACLRDGDIIEIDAEAGTLDAQALGRRMGGAAPRMAAARDGLPVRRALEIRADRRIGERRGGHPSGCGRRNGDLCGSLGFALLVVAGGVRRRRRAGARSRTCRRAKRSAPATRPTRPATRRRRSRR